MRTGRLSPVVAALLFTLAAVVPAAAQETRGSIEGVVKDATGGALPGVTVIAKLLVTNASQQTVSDSNGAYRFPALAPGIYELTATLSGFNPTKLEKVILDQIGQILKIDLVMTVAGVAITETVRAESPIVDVKQNAVTITMTADLIDLLPKDRNFLSALTGIAGLNNESVGGGIMIDGSSGSENRIVIDGQDTTHLRTGTSGKDVVMDFIEQIQVKQSGYNAEFRATTGGVVSAITRSGTNRYTGDASFDYRGKKFLGLLGDIRPTLRLDPTVAAPNNQAEYFYQPRTSNFETERADPAFTIGGPILRNRSWFFLGYNPAMTNQDRTVQWSNPVSGGVTYPAVQTFNAKTVNTQYTGNVTLQLSQNVRARVGGTVQRNSSPRSLPGIDANSFVVNEDGTTIGVSNSNPASFNPWPQVHTEGYNDSVSAEVNWNINAATYAAFTGGYLDYGSGSVGGDFYDGIRRSFSGSNMNYLDVPPELQHPSGYVDNPSNSYNFYDNYKRRSINMELTRFAQWKGQHAFKGGVQFERIYNQANTGQQHPLVTVVWNGTLTTLDQRQVRGTYGYYFVGRNYTFGDIGSTNVGFFLQDQWSVSSKLTLNYGMRFDKTHIPSYRPENPGVTFTFADKVAPRLGFAYDIKGDSKWKAYGSWGVFYDIEKLEMPRGLWGAEHWNDHYYTLDSYNWPAINCEGPAGTGCPGTFIQSFDRRHTANDAHNNLTDPNLKPVKTQELVFGLDHELTRLVRVGTRFVHKWLNRTIEDVGVLVPAVGEVFYMSNPGYGLGAYPNGPDMPRTPIPVRDYDAIEFSIARRLANRWSLSSNITFSRLWGNYSGLASADEGGRTSPNVNRFFDGLYMNFTEAGCPDRINCTETYGRLPSDRPVVFKLQGTYQTPWLTSIGATFAASSGLPVSTNVSYKTVPVFVYGRGDLGRTPSLTQIDINVQHQFRLPRRMRLTVQMQVNNVFDQDTVTGFDATPYRTNSFVLPGDGNDQGAAFFNGFNVKAIQEARSAAAGPTSTVGKPDPQYGMANGFQGARDARVYFRFTF